MEQVTPLPGDVEGWRVGTTEFVQFFDHGGSTSERFTIQKNQAIIDLYVALCPQVQQGRIVELGVADGGSTALLALLTSPTKLVACEFSPTPLPALAAFIERHGLTDQVRPYFATDQGNRTALQQIVEDEFGAAPLDLVVDDASHVYDKTLASFEVLFPRLRPGGTFVIEDWATQYIVAQAIVEAQADPASAAYATVRAQYEAALRIGAPPRPPLARLAIELFLVSIRAPEVVAAVTMNHHWLTVQRGPAPLEHPSFRLADWYLDHFGWFDGDDDPSRWWLHRLWERAGSA